MVAPLPHPRPARAMRKLIYMRQMRSMLFYATLPLCSALLLICSGPIVYLLGAVAQKRDNHAAEEERGGEGRGEDRERESSPLAQDGTSSMGVEWWGGRGAGSCGRGVDVVVGVPEGEAEVAVVPEGVGGKERAWRWVLVGGVDGSGGRGVGADQGAGGWRWPGQQGERAVSVARLGLLVARWPLRRERRETRETERERLSSILLPDGSIIKTKRTALRTCL